MLELGTWLRGVLVYLKEGGRGKNKRFWTPPEDNVLIQCLHELASDPRWKSENGFKTGYLSKLETELCFKLPNSGLRADPHIESRLKYWSEKYFALSAMLGTSGFGWDDERRMLQTTKTVFDAWAKNHKKARGLYGVPFPYFDKLSEIYGKDRAIGDGSESIGITIQSMETKTTSEHLVIDSDGDDIDSTATNQGECSEPPKKKAKTLKQKERRYKGKLDDTTSLSQSFLSVSSKFGKIFEDMNSTLEIMSKAWSKTEDREQQLEEKSNRVLEEVMKLEGLSPSKALRAATILSTEEAKLRVFYQAPANLRKQYVLDLLKGQLMYVSLNKVVLDLRNLFVSVVV